VPGEVLFSRRNFCTVFAPFSHSPQPPATGRIYRSLSLAVVRILRSQGEYRSKKRFSSDSEVLYRSLRSRWGAHYAPFGFSRSSNCFSFVSVGCAAFLRCPACPPARFVVFFSLPWYSLFMSGKYPDDWPVIAERIKSAAGWKCQRCGAPNSKKGHYVLTVHHLDKNKSNCKDSNLVALCQKCHLHFQANPDDVNQEFLFGNSFCLWWRILAQKYKKGDDERR